MSEQMEQIRASVLDIVRKTDLPPLPGDGSEPLGVAMRHVMIYLDDEVGELQERLAEREKELASLRAEASLQADEAASWRKQMAVLRSSCIHQWGEEYTVGRLQERIAELETAPLAHPVFCELISRGMPEGLSGDDQALWLNRWLQKRDDRHDCLRAIVARLPKCWRLVDGKLVQDCPVVPGMTVWCELDGEWQKVRASEVGEAGDINIADDDVDEAGGGFWATCEASSCYSTRAAAEVARKEATS